MLDKRRRTLKDLEGKGFVGWLCIIALADECMKTGRKRVRNRALVCGLEATGGRIQEVLMLHRDNFFVEDEFVIVRNMPLLKRYDTEKIVVDTRTKRPTKGKGYKWDDKEGVFILYDTVVTPRIEIRKDFPIPRWEPLVDYLIEYLEDLEESSGYQWLFPTAYKTWDEETPGVQKWIDEKFLLESRAWISTVSAWKVINKLGKSLGIEVWDHWFRAQKNNQLRRDYLFDDDYRNRFFGWAGASRRGTVALYSSLNVDDLINQMQENKGRYEKNMKRDLNHGGR